MSRLPSCAIVSLAAVDLRLRPDHRSELCSQLLMGEIVAVRAASRDGRWLEVVNLTDGDRGWVRRWGLVETGRAGAARWSARARARVTACYAQAHSGPGGEAVLTPLFLGGRVVAGARRGRLRAIELPDGRRGWVSGGAVGPAGPRGRITIERRVASLMGVPYLWGGRTPMGLDCSALTQLVLAERGLRLPRDAHEQCRAARRLGRGEKPLPGDLIFFGSRPRRADHVGLMLGNGLYAHARGVVRVNSIDRDNILYDKELAAQWLGFGRPGSGAEKA